MSLAALLIATIVASALSVAFGFWWRGHADRQRAARPVPTSTNANDDGVFALVDIRLFGDVVRTEMRVDKQLLEQISNSMGATLTDLPSKARH